MALWLGDNYCNAVINISQYTECYDIGFIYDKRLAQEKRMNEREYILDFKTSMKQIQECDFFAYVGKEVNCIEDIEVSYKSATIAKLVSDFSFDNNITYYDENDEKKEFSCDKGKQYMDCLICKIQDNNKEEIINCIDEMYSSFKEYKVNLDMIKININYLLCNLLNIAQELDSVVNEEQAMQYMRSVSLEQIIIKGRENQLKSFSLEFAEYLSQLRENSFQGILNQIYKEISEHYMEKLSLKYLSEKYYINSAYLGQIFKKQYNVSFNDYLNAYRIEKAAELLKRSDDKIYRISEKVGYNNTDYFINKFVQLKEKTPLQYRKQFRCT